MKRRYLKNHDQIRVNRHISGELNPVEINRGWETLTVAEAKAGGRLSTDQGTMAVTVEDEEGNTVNWGPDGRLYVESDPHLQEQLALQGRYYAGEISESDYQIALMDLG